jgi:hypothetical protein
MSAVSRALIFFFFLVLIPIGNQDVHASIAITKAQVTSLHKLAHVETSTGEGLPHIDMLREDSLKRGDMLEGSITTGTALSGVGTGAVKVPGVLEQGLFRSEVDQGIYLDVRRSDSSPVYSNQHTVDKRSGNLHRAGINGDTTKTTAPAQLGVSTPREAAEVLCLLCFCFQIALFVIYAYWPSVA